jgi:phosphate starvation-inducible membrane PsiE
MNISEKFEKKIAKLGDMMVEVFHTIGLFVIGSTIIWSAVNEYALMMNNEKGFATLSDILLLFIYLELGAMIGIYFKTHTLPVVFLLFVGVTAITRYLVFELKNLGIYDIIGLVGAILILIFAVLVLKFSNKKYGDEDGH